MGGYIQLITTDKNWQKFIDIFQSKELFIGLLTKTNVIRNQLAHFRSELKPVQLSALLRTIEWLATRPKISKSPEEQAVKVIPTRTLTPKYTGKYAAIRDWLSEQKEKGKRIQVSFTDIETLLSEPLPASARTHRAWWANDSVSHTQSIAWLSKDGR